MADKRMFTKKITESDAFLDMPLSAQCLYFHLNMSADDDGFVNAPKKIQRLIGASEDDLKLLIAKSFLLVFESGVVVIKHWRMHNTIRQDRYHPTDYKEEYLKLGLKDNNSYTWQPNGNQMATKCLPSGTRDIGLGLDIDLERKENIIKEKKKYGEFDNVLLTNEEYAKLEKSNLLPYIEKLSSYIASKGKKYKNHYATILTWARNDTKKESKEELPKWFDKDFKKEDNDLNELNELLEEFK